MFLVFSVSALAAQEPSVPKDSALVSINGCAKNGVFTVGERREDQPGTLEIQPGRRFRPVSYTHLTLPTNREV